MATQASLDLVQYAYIAFYGRPADAEGQEWWATKLDENGGDLSAIIEEFSTSAEYDNQYGSLSNTQLVEALYQQILGREADEEGLAYYVGELDSGARSRGAIALDILNGPLNNPDEADPIDVAVLTNRKDVADAFTAAVEAGDKAYGAEQLAAAKALLADVDSDTNPATVDVYAVVSDFPDAGTDPVDPGVDGETQYLAVDQDILTGTEGNDTFIARVAQNMLGAQVNTLGSGDVINGGAGNDTLMAKVTAGLYGFNTDNDATTPIQPETTSVENILIEAVETDLHGAGENTTVVINAKDLLGVDEIGSYRSDADLLIQNLTTKDNNGNGTSLSDMTVSMAYTGNADSKWGESDLTVYFDQDYLVPEGTRTNPVVDFLAMNEDNYDATNGERPLDGVFFRELNFTLNGEEFDLTEFLGEDPAGTGSEITTYAEFLSAVQQALIQLKAANPDNDALQSVTADFGRTFLTDVNPDTLVQREGVSIRLTVDGLTNGVQNTLEVDATDLEVARAAGSEVPNNNRYEIADDEPPVEGERLSINVDLEKVGLAGDGGELVIGSMNKTDANVWGAVNTVVEGTTSGIEEFNVTVYGNDTKSSSLSGLHSTNNNLRVITVDTDENQAGTYANLTIGNSNSNGAGVKDIQTIDASGFKGDLSVTAELTEEITAKYMDLQDEAAPAADNVEFTYTGGEGDDTFIVALDSANLSNAGTTTREDFELTINGGEGDDYLVLAVVDDTSASSNYDFASFGPWSTENILANWYDNNKLDANLTLNGGEGDDTIWTPGSGDVVINAGSGNDTVYADNLGDKAVWAFNVMQGAPAAREELDNLQSDANDSYNLFRSTVVVNFKGFEVEVELNHTQGVVTDLDINQAIKTAINSNDVLNKLLVANDGPANTLVVTSLIDGAMVEGDLEVSLEAPDSLTAGEVQQLSGWLGLTGQTAENLIDLIEAQIAAFDTKADYSEDFALSGGSAIVGSDSLHTSDNRIEGDTGDDVLVLGTGRLSNDTVVYEDFGNGTDTIVNFSTLHGEQDIIETGYRVDTVTSITVTFADIEPTNNTTGVTLAFNGGAPTTIGNVAGQALIPGADVAYDFALANATYTDGNGTVWTVSYEDGALTFSQTGGVIAEGSLTAADFDFTNVNNAATDAYVATFTENVEEVAGSAPEAEVFSVDFNGTVAVVDSTFTFDGVTINVTTGDGPIELVEKVLAASFPNWTVVELANGQVEFTANATGDQTDATAADFGVVTPAAAVAEVFTLDLTGTTLDADIDNTIAFDGSGALALPANATAADIATALAGGTFTNWTAVANGNTVTFTATTAGAVTDVTVADFTLAAGTTAGDALTASITVDTQGAAAVTDNGIDAVVNVTNQGVDAVGAETTYVTGTTNSADGDYIDFSDYGVVAVYVDGVLVTGTAPNDENELYVTLTESATNAGEYTMRVVDSGADGEADTTVGGTAADDDAIVGVIGVADFGETQNFVEANFII